jgi:hypothetical protein
MGESLHSNTIGFAAAVRDIGTRRTIAAAAAAAHCYSGCFV